MFLADGVGVLLHQAQISPLIFVPLRQQLHLAALVRHLEMVDVVQLDVQRAAHAGATAAAFHLQVRGALRQRCVLLVAHRELTADAHQLRLALHAGLIELVDLAVELHHLLAKLLAQLPHRVRPEGVRPASFAPAGGVPVAGDGEEVGGPGPHRRPEGREVILQPPRPHRARDLLAAERDRARQVGAALDGRLPGLLVRDASQLDRNRHSLPGFIPLALAEQVVAN
mmetsp:Transcript_10773/g.27845  ORF Transcript_10773/g.27845 Transcript_10773/m.27845 type:complete len:226 (-) Transcript_10773:534-1211(-)